MQNHELLDNIFQHIENRPAIGQYNPHEFDHFLNQFEEYLTLFNFNSIIKRGGDLLLIAGDLSGIQNTVYTISARGALKSLRARSFLLELLCEHLCYEIITNMTENKNYYQQNVVFSGGGRFCLLLPYTANIEIVDSICELVNEWAFTEFGGKLAVSISTQKVSIKDLEKGRFYDIWKNIGEDLENKKHQKFSSKLDELFSDPIKLNDPIELSNEQECQICHLDDKAITKEEPFWILLENDEVLKIDSINELIKNEEKGMTLHNLCYHLLEIGKKLTTVKNIYRFKSNEQKKGTIKLFKYNKVDKSDYVFYSLEKPDKCTIEYEWLVNQCDIKSGKGIFLYSSYSRQIGDLPNVKQNNNLINNTDTATFQDLAESSNGASLIGCLRMDVDGLGEAFHTTLIKQDICYLSYLSRLLDLFFKVIITSICKHNLNNFTNMKFLNLTDKDYSKGRNISVIYAGGDDLFITGSWDETCEIAFDIQKLFAMYSGMGISGGVSLHQPDFPLYQMAAQSGIAEHESKSTLNVGESKPVKNKITLFYSPWYRNKRLLLNSKKETVGALEYCLEWNDNTVLLLVENFIHLGNIEQGTLKFKDLSRSFIYKLFHLAEVWWGRQSMYIPTFIYLVERNRVKIKSNEDLKYFNQIIDLIIKRPNYQENKNQLIKSIRIPVTWIDLLLRKKGEQNNE